MRISWKKGALVAGGLSALAAYAGRRSLFTHWFGLPPVKYRIAVHRDLRVVTPDGVILASDHYAPRHAADAQASFPTVLIRTPYGKGLAPVFHARRFAERGYHVIVQDVRGRFGSGGRFEPFINEAQDGLATLHWLRKQPWFNGVLGTWGQSYLAYTQWALATAAPEAVTALFPGLPSSRGPASGRVDDAQLLELPLRWMVVLDALRYLPGGQGPFLPWRAIWRLAPRGQDSALASAFRHIPLSECDELAIGAQVPYFRQLVNGDMPPYWQQADLRGRIAELERPVHLLGGWYDFMLVDMLRDFAELNAAGRAPFLTIGPWHHVHPEISSTTLREGLAWFDAHLKGNAQNLQRKRVRVFVMGAGEWREFDDWPPDSSSTSLYLQSGGKLSPSLAAATGEPDSYMYDPTDPTPAVGGALFFSGAGARDNRSLEARSDVLTYTTSVLDRDVDVIGPVRAELYLTSSRAHTDFFARLCDVYPDGRSMNICDGIVRLHPHKARRGDDGVLCIIVDMLATAHRFRKGHAIRLQLSSGAHPRFARNPGIAGLAQSEDDMRCARQTVYHDALHPSRIIIPLV